MPPRALVVLGRAGWERKSVLAALGEMSRIGRAPLAAVGDDERWRRRMLGGSSGLDEHRRWWSANAGLVLLAEIASRRFRGAR